MDGFGFDDKTILYKKVFIIFTNIFPEKSSGCAAGCIAGIVIACCVIVAAAVGGGCYIYEKK